MLTRRGKIVFWTGIGILVILAIAGWIKAWYWPTVTTHTVTEYKEAPPAKEIIKWRTRVVTREIKVKDAPEKVREEAKAREGDELLTAAATPSAPYGGTAQAWLSLDGGTRILFRANPRPLAELGGKRMVYAAFDMLDPSKRQTVGISQELGRLGFLEVLVRAEAENRRGDVGWKADIIVGVTF